MNFEQLESWLNSHEKMIDKVIEGTCIKGYGISYKKTNGKLTDIPSLVFYVSKKLSAQELTGGPRIPSSIGAQSITEKNLQLQTDVQEIEESKLTSLTTLATDPRVRPVPGAVRISTGQWDTQSGHHIGALGCWVKDRYTGKIVMLSSYFVLMNYEVGGNLGDPIYQPPNTNPQSPVEEDVFAFLHRYQKIIFDGKTPNLINAAIALPKDPSIVDFGIQGIGNNVPKTLGKQPHVGMKVKIPTPSGLKNGRISATMQKVEFGSIKYDTCSVYKKQFFVESSTSEPILMAGDYGSVVLDEFNSLVGLVFASTYVDGIQQAVATPIRTVFNELGLEVIS